MSSQIEKHRKPTMQETLHSGESALSKTGMRPRPIDLSGKRASKGGDFPVDDEGYDHPDPKVGSSGHGQKVPTRKAYNRRVRNKGRS